MQSLYSPGTMYYNQQGDLIGGIYHREFTGDAGLAVMARSVHGEAQCFQTQNEALVWLAAGDPWPPANVIQLPAPPPPPPAPSAAWSKGDIDAVRTLIPPAPLKPRRRKEPALAAA